MIGLRPWAIPALLSRRRGVTWAQFFSGRVGAVWDPRLLSQMSTSRTGGTWGVSLSDTVGYVVDQARGGTAALGANSWNNGSATTSGESSIVSSGVFRVYTSAGVYSAVSVASAMTIGKAYNVTFTVDSIATTGGGVRFSDNGPVINTTGAKSFTVVAATTAAFIKRESVGVAADYQISGVTVRELPGCHMIASSDARRATLVGYDGGSTPALYANGAHGYGSSSTLDLSASDEVTVIQQVKSVGADTGTQMFAELSAAANSNNGCFRLYRYSNNRFAAGSRGTTDVLSESAVQAGAGGILVMRAKISTDYLELLRNGNQIATSAGDQGGPVNYASAQTLYWMSRATTGLFATAEFGPLAIIGGALSADDLATAVALAAY